MNNFKNIFKKTNSNIQELPSFWWLFILIFLPINFFLFKEKKLQEKNSSPYEIAFISPQTQAPKEILSQESLNFFITSTNKKNNSCQINFLLNQKNILQQEVVLKKEKKAFSFPKDFFQKTTPQKGDKIEIILECENTKENIYKYF